ncbi:MULTISPECIES: LacI family transcriptional regulator [unclassified Lysobacter]|uniref:LacI family transcriptional regulator n=1 Tax=unclassified Lysobacter TaxID=2635362 RepID=UPI001BE4E7FB|nr:MULTISPECIES: LacI family transcriptional regulator [unclassified Lysobacter]MBT2746206.1 LacI family transcriptional regulator [Lysobacter sp. ISL-42]MBT2750751.1 LacI family transcriptional regulator [Lysobacter sp. ISL-50]MBT2776102.1 LacI family transcriptional regulator [Lysobacter sp. ISL-54]MBT2784608.1 LacI family transcriptional regulator [Lysobacter sp. ISL-52]
MSPPVIRVDGDTSVVQISNGDSVVRIPIQLRRRSGKRRLRPAKVQCAALSSELTALQAALARGYRWRDMLDHGEVASTKDIADSGNIDRSYVSRMINMTMLTPEIIESILDDTLPDFTLADIAIAPPDLWDEQLRKFRLRRTSNGLVQDP